MADPTAFRQRLPDGVRMSRAGLATAGALAQLLCIVLVYQFAIDFTCVGRADAGFCRAIGAIPAQAVSLLAFGALYALARPQALAPLTAPSAPPAVWRPLAALQLAGFALILAPAPLAALWNADLLRVGPPFWLVGAPAAAAGAVLLVARPAVWAAFLRAERRTLVPMALAAAALPMMVTLSDPLWRWEPVTKATFGAVAWTLTSLSDAVTVDPARYAIGMGDFVVQVASQCSGVQGFALVTVFVGLYAVLFRRETRFPHVWLLLPIGIAASWVLNVVRVAALIAIGDLYSPDLAVNGFHSHAGWLFFTLIALGLTAVARATPFFSTAAGAPAAARPAAPPLTDDPRAAEIAPFIVFMASALLASTLVETPALAYPLRAAAMAAALWAFRAHYRRMAWSVDLVAVWTGVVIGLLWIARTPADAGAGPLAEALAAMGGGAFALWAAARVIGTVALVPLIEELLFRAYLIGRFDDGRPATRLLLLAVSTALFAALHGRWVEASVAGLAFGLVYLRRGRLCDAVVAHAVANVLVAWHAAATGGWSAI